MKDSSGLRKKYPEVRFRQLAAALRETLRAVRLEDLPARVRELPDERTLRFYATIGLLAPPIRFDGRRAMYGVKHLLQLVALKRLQSRGMSIREIGDTLRNAAVSRLSDVARIDGGVLRKAMAAAACDASLNLWPRRPAAPRDHRASRQAPVQSYRPASGLYVMIDPSLCRLSVSKIGRKLSAFAKFLSSVRPPADDTPGGGA